MDQSVSMDLEVHPVVDSGDHPPDREKKMPGIRMKFKDPSQRFNPEDHEESLQAKIELIFGSQNISKDISFSEDREYVYIELKDPEGVKELMSAEISLRTNQPLIKEEIDLMEIKIPYLIVYGLENWMSHDVIEDYFKKVTKEKVQSVVLSDDATTATVKFVDPKVCLTLDSNSEIMGSEVTLQVEYEIPSRNIEESLVLVVEPLPIPKIPKDVVENQLKKFFFKHFSKSPIECKIVTKTAYLTFENSAVVNQIISNPPDRPFHPDIKMSARPASEAIPHDDEEMDVESGPTSLSTSTDNPLSLSLSITPDKLEPKLTEVTNYQELPLASTEQSITKVLIDDIPSLKRDAAQLEAYMTSLMKLPCSVKQYGKLFVATFERAIDYEQVKLRGNRNNFGGVCLSFYKLGPTDTILVEHIAENIPELEDYLKYHFQKFTGPDSIDSVTVMTGNKALIKFYTCESVQRALSAKCSKMGQAIITVSEHYDSIPLGDIDDSEASTPLHEVEKRKWEPINFEVKSLEALWLEGNLNDLNNKLEKLSARACMSKKQSNSRLEVMPLDGASSLENWAMDMENIVAETRAAFADISLQIPEILKSEIFQRAQNVSGPTLLVRLKDSTLILGGHKTQVMQIEDNLKQYIIEFQIEEEIRDFPKRLVYCLHHFLGPKLAINGVEKYLLSHKEAKISVTGNQEGRQQFWKFINDKHQLVQEKNWMINKHMFNLLRTDKGSKKIEEILGLSSHVIVYYLEQTSETCSIYFMSCTVEKDVLKMKKNEFKKCYDEKSLEITNTQLHGCGDRRWKDFVKKLEHEYLVIVTVDASTVSITVTGEKNTVSDICNKIKSFLSDIFSVEDKLTLSYHEWKVISSHAMQKIEAIKKDLKGATILTPTKGDVRGLQAIIDIRGDPAVVKHAKTRLQALQAEVCHKEDKMNNVPAAQELISRMQDKIQLMETTMQASIDISVIKEESSNSLKAEKQVVSRPQNVCFATLKNEIRIIVYKGNFTNHGHSVDTIINFVSFHPSDSDANLKELKATSNGSRIIDQFRTMLNYTRGKSGEIIKPETHGALKCSHLWHVLLEPWNVGKTFTLSFFLGIFLEKIFKEASDSRTILLTTTCAKPLNYPAEVFAKKIIESLKTRQASPDSMVIVYIDKSSDATEFEKQFNDPSNECRILKQDTSSSLSSKKTHEKQMQSTQKKSSSKRKPANAAIKHAQFIMVEKGDMTKTKADVLVNSTNKDLNLSCGMVSNILLKKCGEELQKECSKLAPLLPGEVAITSAKNLSCTSIYHIVLQSPKEQDAVENLKKSLQKLLQKTYDQNIGSIAFPSLGVGHLGYSPKLSAKIICEEIIAFRNRNLQSTTKYNLVIFDSKVHDEFKKTVDDILAGSTDLVEPPVSYSLSQGHSSGSISLTIENSDISDEACDVIVNTTTEQISSSHSAVSKAIMAKGGPILQHQCSDLVKNGFLLGHGDIKIMNVQGLGKLKCKKIIHTHVSSKGANSYYIVHQIVTNCIKEAEKNRMKSIALPAFGLGTGRYSVPEVAEPMFVALTEFGLSSPKLVETIKIVINDQQKYKEFCDYFTMFFKLDSPGILSAVSSFVVSTFTGKSQTRSVDLSSLDPSILDNLGNSLVLFSVYAPSLKVCQEIIQTLIEFIKDQCMDEPIQNPIIEHLLSMDKKEILKVGRSRKVEIEILKDINTINITGAKTDVINARIDITEILTEVERIHTALQNYQWKTIDDEDIELYSPEDSYILERAYNKKMPTLKLVIDGMDCYVNLNTYEETTSSGNVRKIKREQKIKHTVPPLWITQQGVNLIDVPASDSEYKDALQEFNNTIGRKVSIVSLKRIENHTVYIQHRSFLEAITQKHPHKDIVIKRLFHGSGESSIAPILNQGFNRNFAGYANAAVYGCGVYFALKADYSARDQYSVPSSDGVKYIFICSVIIGEYTIGNSRMKIAPPLAPGSDLLYDTLVNKDKPTIFVALTDGQAYPDYLVSYKVVLDTDFLFKP